MNRERREAQERHSTEGGRQSRKQIAAQTVQIIRQGYYEREGRRIEIAALQQRSEAGSFLLRPQDGERLLEQVRSSLSGRAQVKQRVTNEATVTAILSCAPEERQTLGVLNFASAKNPGGGFLGGAMAQEESLAASSGLYASLLLHEEYYTYNRARRTMMYSHHAIVSPDVVFFRDEQYRLLAEPVTATVLTMPAVNYGQVVVKGEDTEQAECVMKERMELVLAIFAKQGMRKLVLGAYGCGVFRNDPAKVAGWWRELLEDKGYGALFDEVIYAVLDSSKNKACMRAFEQIFRSSIH